MSEDFYKDIIDNETPAPQAITTTVKPKQQKHVPQPPKLESLGDQKNISDVISTNWNFGKVLYKDDACAFKILEVEVPDATTGATFPGYTVGQYIIQGDRKTKWLKYNKNALYYIRYGVAWFMIGEEGAVLTAGNYICVPENTRHSVLNKSSTAELKIDLIFGGRIVRKV